MFDYSKIYKELDKLHAKGFALEKAGDTRKLSGKNFDIEVTLTYKGISLEMEVEFDDGRQLEYRIDNDLYDLEKNQDMTNELLEDMRMFLSGIADGTVRYGYISKKPTILFASTDGPEILYLGWVFTTGKRISPVKAKEYSDQLVPLN